MVACKSLRMNPLKRFSWIANFHNKNLSDIFIKIKSALFDIKKMLWHRN